jgi:hypothetical protein
VPGGRLDDRDGSRPPRDDAADVGAARDLTASLRRGYARYQAAIAATAVARRLLDRRRERSPWRDVAIAGIVAGAVGSVVTARRPVEDAAAAWWDALTSAGASAAGLVAGPVATSPGTWPAASREASALAQWTSAGVSLLGPDGPDRFARLAVIAAPYLVWPRGRRSLRRSRRLYEAATALATFGLSGRLIVTTLRSTAAAVDERAEQVVTTRAKVAALAEQARLREVVIAETADRLRAVRAELRRDRSSAAARARDEEQRLRAWLSEEGADDPVLATATATAPTVEATETARRVGRFAATAESVLRAGAAAQLVVETATARRPTTARLLAATAVGHAAWSCRRLLADGDRAPVVAADLGVLALCGVLEVVESGRGWEPGWTRGYTEALFAATGCVHDDRRLGTLAVAGVATVSAATTLPLPSDGTSRVLAAAERSASAALSAAVGRWFVRLVDELGSRLTDATEQLAAARAAAAAEQIRRDAQHLLHDAALQVLLWVQKPDLSDEQLLAWLDREIEHLDRAAAGSTEAPELARGLDELVRGFELLGLTADVAIVGDVAALPPEVGAAVLEVCNEALANVLRHSHDRTPAVRLTADADRLTVEVVNRTDPPVGPIVVGTGSRAMADRVAAVGGEIEMGPTSHGFRVRARLPVRSVPGYGVAGSP